MENETAPVLRSGTVPSLELIRGLASLDVFIFHFCILGNISNGLSKMFAWGTEAVIVFFVLSGYVIGLSQQRRRRGPVEFLQARVRRICPIYFLAMGLGLIVAACLHAPIHFWQIAGNLVFLQSFSGSLVQPLGTNFPLWSLGTEFQFYTLFAVLLFFRRNWLWLAWWWIALASLVVRHSGYYGSGAVGLALETLSMSPCWLLGYFASNLRNRRSLSMVQALTLFSMIPMVTRSNFTYTTTNESVYNVAQFFVVALLIVPLIHTLAVRHLYPGEKPMTRVWPWIGAIFIGVALYALTHNLVHISVMAGFIAVPAVVAVAGHLWQAGGLRWPIRGLILREVSLFLGGASYALYAIHDPLCRLVIHYTPNHLLQFVLVVPLVGCGTLALEYLFQPRAAKWLDRLWSRGRANRQANSLAPSLSLDR